MNASRFLDPRTLAAISDLGLLAKTVVDGFMLGAHQSPKSGAGLEFSQYRSYEPGDDLRRIDWKMYARSDRYYVREAEIETSIAIRFILDTSASMAHEDRGMSKFDYARFLVASLGFLAHNQGDAIGLSAINHISPFSLAPKFEHQHLHLFLHHLEKLQPAGTWPKWLQLEGHFTGHSKREMIILITDLHEVSKEIRDALSRLKAMKNEVSLIQILGRNELDFGYTDTMTFEELETGRVMQVNAKDIRKSYQINFRQHIENLRKEMHDQDISHELFAMDQPLDFALRKYLKQRARLG
ncbi:MAG: DUF58 domain-containing protein [bacterium]